MYNDLQNQILSAREIIHKEYCRYSAYLSVNYNYGHKVQPLNDDSQSTRLVLVTRGRKKLLNCLLLNQTWKILKKTKNIENVFYSKDVYTVAQPRISLTIKFGTITFTELANIL